MKFTEIKIKVLHVQQPKFYHVIDTGTINVVIFKNNFRIFLLSDFRFSAAGRQISLQLQTLNAA